MNVSKSAYAPATPLRFEWSAWSGRPAVANLEPTLLAALRRAATDAAADGIKIVVNSGWRSAEYQERLRPQAIHDGCPRMYADPTHDSRMRQ